MRRGPRTGPRAQAPASRNAAAAMQVARLERGFRKLASARPAGRRASARALASRSANIVTWVRPVDLRDAGAHRPERLDIDGEIDAPGRRCESSPCALSRSRVGLDLKLDHRMALRRRNRDVDHETLRRRCDVRTGIRQRGELQQCRARQRGIGLGEQLQRLTASPSSMAIDGSAGGCRRRQRASMRRRQRGGESWAALRGVRQRALQRARAATASADFGRPHPHCARRQRGLQKQPGIQQARPSIRLAAERGAIKPKGQQRLRRLPHRLRQIGPRQSRRQVSQQRRQPALGRGEPRQRLAAAHRRPAARRVPCVPAGADAAGGDALRAANSSPDKVPCKGTKSPGMVLMAVMAEP